MIILDTDVTTLMHAGHAGVAKRLEANADDIAITIVTFVETLRGRFEFLMKASGKEQFLQAQRLLQTSLQRLEELPTLFLDSPSLDHFESLTRKKGIKRIGRADLLVASIALAHDATLVTRNLKHFKLVPGLKCENWVD